MVYSRVLTVKQLEKHIQITWNELFLITPFNLPQPTPCGNRFVKANPSKTLTFPALPLASLPLTPDPTPSVTVRSSWRTSCWCRTRSCWTPQRVCWRPGSSWNRVELRPWQRYWPERFRTWRAKRFANSSISLVVVLFCIIAACQVL